MSYFTRQRQAMVPHVVVEKEYNEEDHPRDEHGRWVAVSFGDEGFGLERVAETGGKSLRRVGGSEERFPTKEMARAHADVLNRAGEQIPYGPKNRSDAARGRGPLKGHPYHGKTDDELRYIVRDAGEAARAMGRDRPQQEGKYLDQMNDAASVLYHRKLLGQKKK